ncbi:polyprenyl diphosphate synthase [Amycolatopsis magusensis]|uniref:polyprenyl diphosphate synthase n=1 Tax=Amycolatopsis magusensis TaxID=882444 RepID=UPI0024A8EE6C|nr:polyprenyl diphosphate synthase [Amycolatopsis magusensis]MDI5975924.1 polyprenyl diphosphate synthase [Amycolatopsis magusensis]
MDATELHESFQRCERELRGGYAPIAVAVELLPRATRPFMYALAAFAAHTDHLADENPGDPGAIITWRAETLDELRRGHSDHPLRRAFVHTVRTQNLDHRVVEELLDGFVADSAAPPRFETVADQRAYLRAVSGTVAELGMPLLEPTGSLRELARLLSVLGEVFQLVDIFQDFPIDLARGRCYLPAGDLRRLGLTVEDLRGTGNRPALDALIELQRKRAADLLDQGSRAMSMVHPSSEPFLSAGILAVQAYLDELSRQKSAALTRRMRLPMPKTLPTGWNPVHSTTRPRRIRLTRARGPLRLRGIFTKRRAPLHAEQARPHHAAVILDGNRRWATAQGKPIEYGHRAGMENLIRLAETASDLAVPYMSVFAFSVDNWSRSEAERTMLFTLFAHSIEQHRERLHQQGIRLQWCGRRDRVPPGVRSALEATEQLTANNTGTTLTVCLDYGGRTELLTATRALAAEAATGLINPAAITEDDLVRRFYLPDLPPVDLLIRTSGEKRIGNFLPWQAAYAELVFEPVPWPDFTRDHLLAALDEYSRRRRRFGGNNDTPVPLPA